MASRRQPPGSDPQTAADSRHYVTMLFSDLCGSTHLGHMHDPEVLDQVLQEVKSAASRVVSQHDGIVVQFHGDGVMAIFGYPTPREDDVRRATEAAIEVHRTVRELPLTDLVPRSFRVRLHSGIHSGLVLVREGDSVKGRFELIGDPPNTAAGLCAHAGVDEILVSAQILRSALPFFDTEEAPPARLKGIPEPIPVFRVLCRSEVNTRYEAQMRRGLTPFIGRAFELARLFQCLGEAPSGRLKVARLIGDAGIGKTRAVEEFLSGAEARGFVVYRGYCESYGSVAPLQPFLLILEQIFQLGHGTADASAIARIETRLSELELERHAPEILRILALRAGARDGADRGGPQRSDVTVDALSDLLSSLTSKHPVVLFIDDWQWVDDATRQLLGSLMRGMREAPLLILTASRPVDPTGEVTDGVEILELAPFSVDESAQAIEALLPAGLDTDVASTIHERSGGNPLFLEELCQSLTDASETADSDLGVPATLHGLIEARVHRLPRAQAELVREAAVIGNVIPSWLFEQVSGYRQDDEILRQLASNDLIYAGETEGMFRFKHGITRDVVYQSIGLIQRRALHRRIAEILEKFRTVEGREEPYEALAYHYAGCADHLEASRYAELAGDRAMASAALDLARQQYAAALASLDQLEPTPERRRRWLAISTRRAFAGIFSPAPEQLEMLGQAAEYARELGDLDALGHARLWLGFVNVCMGEHKESIDQYQQGLRVAEEAGNAKLIAQFRANLGQSLAAACEYTEALALLDESIETKKRLQVGKRSGVAPTGSAFAIACKACVMGELGEFAQAHDLIDQALEAMRGSGNPVLGSIHGFHAIILLWQGRWEDCLETANRVRATGERINVPYLFGRRRSEAAYARFMLTGERDALEVLQQTSDWLDERRMRLYISLNYGCLTDAMTRVSEIDLARHYGQRALERAAQHDLVGEGMACRALARLAARESPAGEPSADRYLGMAMESARARNSKREIAITRFGQAELSAQRGRRREAEAFLDEARPEFQRMGMQWHETEAERLAEALGL